MYTERNISTSSHNQFIGRPGLCLPRYKLWTVTSVSTIDINVVSGFCVHLKNTSRTLNEITTLFEFGQIGGACYTYDDMIIHVVSG